MRLVSWPRVWQYPEPLGRVVPHVVLQHVRAADEFAEHCEAIGMLQVDCDALLPAVARHPKARLEKEAVERRVVHRDHCRTKVGEELRAERTRDSESEVEHDDPFERRTNRPPGARDDR